MKILVIGPHFPDSFARNIAVTLSAMGHDVHSIAGTRIRHHGNRLVNAFWRYVPRLSPAIEHMNYALLLKSVRRWPARLTIVTHAMMPPDVVDEIRRFADGPVVCWFTDPLPNLPRQYLIASCFDAFFFKEPTLVRLFADKLAKTAAYLPECCNPIWHDRVELSQEEKTYYGCDLAAIGTLHYYRAKCLEAFIGYDLKIWGTNAPAWMTSPVRSCYRLHFVAETTKAKACAAAKIIVNTINYADIEGVNCTCFEAAGCGAFQIADHRPTLDALFEPGGEIITYRTSDELKELVDRFLVDQKGRRRIADSGHRRAHAEHTYQNRLRDMFKSLGLGRRALAMGTPNGNREAKAEST